MKTLHAKLSINEMSDRHLLEFLLSNQLVIYRKLRILEEKLNQRDPEETEKEFTYFNVYKDLMDSTHKVADQIETYYHEARRGMHD